MTFPHLMKASSTLSWKTPRNHRHRSRKVKRLKTSDLISRSCLTCRQQIVRKRHSMKRITRSTRQKISRKESMKLLEMKGSLFRKLPTCSHTLVSLSSKIQKKCDRVRSPEIKWCQLHQLLTSTIRLSRVRATAPTCGASRRPVWDPATLARREGASYTKVATT